MTQNLLERGADALAMMPNGDTVLSKARGSSTNLIIGRISGHGLLGKLLDGNGNSARHIIFRVITSGCDDAVECFNKLLDNGLVPNLRDQRGAIT